MKDIKDLFYMLLMGIGYCIGVPLVIVVVIYGGGLIIAFIIAALLFYHLTGKLK
jgi:uncharacterized oligopeptide transporter (OPT) family protein